MEGISYNFVTIGDCFFGCGLPCLLEFHAIIENVVTETDILVPHVVGAE